MMESDTDYEYNAIVWLMPVLGHCSSLIEHGLIRGPGMKSRVACIIGSIIQVYHASTILMFASTV